MTLISALICTDGIVMASDGQSTFPTAAGFMRLPSEKIKKIGERVLWGGAGDVGLLQKIEITLCNLKPEIWARPIGRLRPDIRAGALGEQKASATTFLPVVKEFPQPTAHVLFAGYDKGTPWILEIDPNGSDTQLEGYGFAAVGSGAHFVYGVLSGFGKHTWTLETGKILSYKIIHEAINVAAFGLGPPLQMWELPKGGAPTPVANIAGIRDAYESWVEIQLAELSQLTAQPAPGIPSTSP